MQLALVEAAQAGATLEKAEKEWTDLEQTRHELVQLQRQIDEATARIVARQRELQQSEGELEALRKRSDTQSALDERQAIEAGLAEMVPLQSRLDTLMAEKTKLAEQAGNLRGINQALGPETEPLKQRAIALEAATDPTCPTCGQPLTDDHRHQLLESLQHEIEQRRERYRDNQQQIRALEAEVASRELEQTGLSSRLKERAVLDRRLGEIDTWLEHAGEAGLQAQQLEEKLGRWRGEIAQEELARQEIERRADASEQLLRTAAWTCEGIETLRQTRRLADERVGAARQQLSALEALEKQQHARLEEQAELGEALGLYDDLRQAFGKRGVPAMLIETAVPELERHANDLLGRISDGRLHVRIETQRETKAGDVREALDIIISDELGSRAYELYSGGEAFRINFAIRIGLSRLLAQRSGAQLRSLFIDEGFGTQDARGREQLIAAINSIQDDFDLILVITHIEELKEAFPARIEVSKTPQGSRFVLM